MTLIVSLRTADGIVIAGDSFSTLSTAKQLEENFNPECPNCKQSFTFKSQIHNIYHSNTLSHTQKVFPFLEKFGVGTWGAGQILRKTIYFAIRELEQTLSNAGEKPKTVVEVAETIGKYIQNLMMEQLKQENQSLIMGDNNYLINFQIVGYNEKNPTIIEINIGKDIPLKEHDASCVASGSLEVVNALFSRHKENPREQPVFNCFSLQDAITYAEFLIRTTAMYQQFSSNMAVVGGEIDVAFFTPFDGFKWIKRKSLQAKLFAEAHENSNVEPRTTYLKDSNTTWIK